MIDTYTVQCDACNGTRVEPAIQRVYRPCQVCNGNGRIVIKAGYSTNWLHFVVAVAWGGLFVIGLLELVSTFSR